MSPTPVFAQMQRLDALKTEAQRELDTILQSGASTDLPASLKDYSTYQKLIREVIASGDSPELRTKIIQHLIHKIEVLPNAFRIHYHAGQNRFLPLKEGKESGVHTPGSGPFPGQRAHGGPRSLSPPDALPNFLIFSGSNSLTNGRDDGNPATSCNHSS
jgi:hypothetical protein